MRERHARARARLPEKKSAGLWSVESDSDVFVTNNVAMM